VPRSAGAFFAPAKFASAKYAPAKFAPAKFAPAKFAPAKFASAKYAPAKFAPAKFAPAKFASAKFAPAKFASAKYAPAKFAPAKFARPSSRRPSSRRPSSRRCELALDRRDECDDDAILGSVGRVVFELLVQLGELLAKHVRIAAGADRCHQRRPHRVRVVVRYLGREQHGVVPAVSNLCGLHSLVSGVAFGCARSLRPAVVGIATG
jgi:hypothetical protein